MNRHGERQVAALQSIEDPINAYIVQHIDPEDDYLYRLYRATNIHTIHGRMASGHIQGRLLKMLVTMIRPRNILEVGTFSGYSALCMAEGLDDDGKLYTFEINDEMEDFIHHSLALSPFGDRVVVHIGDALEVMQELLSQHPFDLVYIDANKRDYSSYYQLLIPALPSQALILADNTLWDGKVLQSPPPRDAQTQGILDFNDLVAGDLRVEVVMLPLRDGLTLIRKR